MWTISSPLWGFYTGVESWLTKSWSEINQLCTIVISDGYLLSPRKQITTMHKTVSLLQYLNCILIIIVLSWWHTAWHWHCNNMGLICIHVHVDQYNKLNNLYLYGLKHVQLKQHKAISSSSLLVRVVKSNWSTCTVQHDAAKFIQCARGIWENSIVAKMS